MITTPTADICDAHPNDVRILNANFRSFSDIAAFSGPCRLIALHGTDVFLADLLKTPGNGAVAVVAISASPKPAVFGDGMAASAQANGWAGVIIDGPLRDVRLIAPRTIGIRATHTVPNINRNGPAGTEADALTVAGVSLTKGDVIVADEDGIVAVPAELAGQLT